MNPVALNHEDGVALSRICGLIPGYSGITHQGFFKMLLTDPKINNVLMLGVYHGRDMAIILDLARRWRPEIPLCLWGVDKFTDDACADWPEEKKGLSWRVAGFGEPPCGVVGVKKNIYHAVGPLRPAHGYTVLQSDDSEYLLHHGRSPHGLKFDAVYCDTSHDFVSVSRQIEQSKYVLRPGGILCGDDYSDDSNAGGSWGVKKAVTVAFPRHTVFGNWIWITGPISP